MSSKSFSNKFRTEQGVHYTKGLFYEMTLADKSTVLYTLKDQDHEGFESLFRLYMEKGDLTEWEFANEYLGGWNHWQQLCATNWFKPYVERWRHELELKIRAAALKRIQSEAKSNSKNSFTANKFLVDSGWKSKEEKKDPVGRPSKEAIARKAKEFNLESDDINSDLERITSNLVN